MATEEGKKAEPKKRSQKIVKFKSNDSAKHIKKNHLHEITAESAANFVAKGWGEIVK